MSCSVVEEAVRCLGRGYDVTSDFRLKYCKGDQRLVALDKSETRDLVIPGFGVVPNVSVDVKCDKGDRIRYRSDVLEFNQMSELFNRKHSLQGKIPSGMFNAMFGFNSSSWARDAAKTKGLALHGYFILLFSLHIDRHHLQLIDEVQKSVPTTWNPKALARFIEKYGTHIIVGLGIGGRDVILVRQDHTSKLEPSELKKHLDDVGDQVFNGTCSIPPHRCKNNKNNKAPQAFDVFSPDAMLLNSFSSVTAKDGITVKCWKQGGDASAESHGEWLPTVPSMPDAIHFTFTPITALLKGLPGTGYLSHAINIYLRYKPPIADLENFLDFQSHRMWAPVHNDLPLGPATNRILHSSPALHFTPLGPKLYVNTSQVIVDNRPVTGLRLHLEGMKYNRLAIHLEHLSSTPIVLQDKLEGGSMWKGSSEVDNNERYLEAVQWKIFSHVCTAPVEYDPDWAASNSLAFIVTGAQLLVKKQASKSVLHLQLLYSKVKNCTITKTIREQGLSDSIQKSTFFSAISTSIKGNPEKEKQPNQIVVDSAVYPNGPPMPVQTQKLMKFVETTQVCKGPQDSPGFWIVTGAKLDLEKGKIRLEVKFSLLSFTS
ncbi:hypothetical protein Sjap_014748 [Stephania japonica]|uniref:MACPF domain-containing protein n=1 Tax=Stephania japonica TaxID=461633 RepID=A0AAP0IJD2_9MAGN